MGEVIAFKLTKDGVHMRSPAEGSAKIVTFTGGWHAPMNDQEGNRAPDFKNAAWFERCRSIFSRALGPLWPLVTASLRGAGDCPGEAEQVMRSAHCPLPAEAKRGGISS
jgi:hypothetical protein